MCENSYTASSVYATQLKHYLENNLPEKEQASGYFNQIVEELASMSALSDRLTLTSLLQVVESLLAHSNIAPLGLLVGNRVHPADFGILTHSLMHCDNLKQALSLTADYIPLLNEGFAAKFSEVKGKAHNGLRTFRLDPLIQSEAMAHLIEMEFAAIVKMGKFLAGYENDKRVHPCKVLFRHQPFANEYFYEQIFDSEVVFECEHNEIWVDGQVLDIPVHSANAGMFKMFTGQLKRMYARLPNQNTKRKRLSSEVYEYLSEAIIQASERNFSFPSIDETAKKFHISISGLKKNLQSENTNFTALADEVRKKTAVSMLISEKNIKEISRRLGFSNSSAFIKAFRRWTGYSPSKYRDIRQSTEEA